MYSAAGFTCDYDGEQPAEGNPSTKKLHQATSEEGGATGVKSQH